MHELWSDIEGFPNYMVSSLGYIMNIKHNRELRSTETYLGYRKVALYNDSGRTDEYVHQLVAVAFIDNFYKGQHIVHIDGDRANNALENLAPRVDVYSPRGYYAKNTRGKEVVLLETGEVFTNAYACAKAINGHASNIYAVLRGEKESYMNYTFAYVSDI